MKHIAIFSMSVLLASNALAQTPAAPADSKFISVPAPALPALPTQAPTSKTAPIVDASSAPQTDTSGAAVITTESRIQAALSQLPNDKAVMFEETMRKNLEANRSKQQELRSLYADIRSNFIGASFDKKAFLEKNQKARDLQEELRRSLDNDLADVADKFDQSERQLLFNALPARYTRDIEGK